jgi:formyl-CoA transferase
MTHTASYGTLPPSTAALHGIVVLDFSHVIAGPFATYYLAALGARVIKVENPHRGDSLRSKPQAFESVNHGKEIVQIDLDSASGRDQAWALFAEADIFVDNMRPGVLERFGFGESVLRQKKPSLIHCSVSGYGRSGDWASRPTFDHVVQAASGMTLLAGKAEDGPIKVGFPVVDNASGMLAALAIIAAIRRRDLTGEGESIDVSMMGAAMQLMYSMTVDTMATGNPPPRVGNVGYSGSPGAETFQCRDGMLALGANTPQQMLALAEVLEISQPVRALLNGQSRGFLTQENGAKIRALLVQALAGQSALDMEQRLNAANVPAAWVRDLAQAVQDTEKHQLLKPWTLAGSAPFKVPGLGFQAKTLFGGRSAPYGLATEQVMQGEGS